MLNAEQPRGWGTALAPGLALAGGQHVCLGNQREVGREVISGARGLEAEGVHTWNRSLGVGKAVSLKQALNSNPFLSASSRILLPLTSLKGETAPVTAGSPLPMTTGHARGQRGPRQVLHTER